MVTEAVDGDSVGRMVGMRVGDTVGDLVGLIIGEVVGLSVVDDWVGTTVGIEVSGRGAEEDCTDGSSVGEIGDCCNQVRIQLG